MCAGSSERLALVMSRLSFHAVALHACCLMLCCVQSRGHNFSGASETDFPGLVPPGGQAESCVAAYRRLSHLHCEGVESTDPSITVQRCYQEAGDAHGVIAFHSNTGSAGQQVYRLRITGPEILLPDILYCGDSAAYAEYTAFTPGDYRAEILHLYEDFSYASSHPALKLQMVLGELDFYVSAPPRKTAGYPQSGLAMLTSGRWVVSAKHHRAFHRTCVTESDKFDACSEAVRTLSSDTDDTLLHWQPHFCPRLAREQDLDLRACLANKRVCFSGDSQMRHAYNGFVALSDGRAQAADYWHNLRHNDHSVLESRFSSYQSNVWGNEVATENCSILFFNVGQWPASYLSEGRPWSAGQYIQQTSQLAARLARAQGEGTSMYWVRCFLHAWIVKCSLRRRLCNCFAQAARGWCACSHPNVLGCCREC